MLSPRPNRQATSAALAALLAVLCFVCPGVRAAAGNVPFPDKVPVPLRVGVAVTVNEMGRISDQAGTFEASVDLRLSWSDPRLAFDSRATGTDRQDFIGEAATVKLAQIWSPQVTVANLRSPARSESVLFIRSDGTVSLLQRLTGTFDTRFVLDAFPFDRQALTFRIQSSKYTMNEIDLVQAQEDINYSGIKEGLRASGWAPVSLDFVFSRSKGLSGDFYPVVEARLCVAREWHAYLLAIFTPFLLVLLIPTVMTLYAKADLAPRLTAWAGSILALVALSFTFSVRYPGLGSNSLVPQLITIGFLYQLLVVTLTLTIFNPQFVEKVKNKRVVPELVAFSRWGVPLGLLGLITIRAFSTAFS